jgi:hypothetical protein
LLTDAYEEAFAAEEEHDSEDFGGGDEEFKDVAYAAFLEQARGHAIIDSGASSGVSSLNAADRLQRDPLAEGEVDRLVVEDSSKVFRFGNGAAKGATKKVVHMPLENGPFEGRPVEFNIVDQPSNHTPPLVGADFLVKNRVVIDYECGYMMYKDRPDVVYPLRRSDRHILLAPLTKEAAEGLEPIPISELAAVDRAVLQTL